MPSTATRGGQERHGRVVLDTGQAHGASGWYRDGQSGGADSPAPSERCQGAFEGAQWRIMRAVSFEYHEPESLREAVELAARFGAEGASSPAAPT